MPGCPPLLCPVCGNALERTDAVYRCTLRHSFDRSRHGYVDLLPHGHGRSNRTGDTGAMIDARHRFLDAGHYAPLRQRLADIAAMIVSGRERPVILDAGCGDGYYLQGVRTGVAGDVCCYGLDISPAALRAAARRCGDCTFFLNDVTHRICMPDGTVDCTLDVFAPRNSAELARVLAPGGRLLVVVPGPEHLRQIAHVLPVSVPAGKLDSTVAALPDFRLETHAKVEFNMALGIEDVVDLGIMGPSGHHRSADEIRAALKADDGIPYEVTASFELLTLARQ
jgi:23S rRNA (guanine745-N1)-methyltransferase